MSEPVSNQVRTKIQAYHLFCWQDRARPLAHRPIPAEWNRMTHTHPHATNDSHAHTHDHGHAHGHEHSHGDPATQGRAFAIAIFLNSAFVAVEFGYGFLAHSTALMADAGHNLSDVLALVLAWGAAILSRKAPSNRFTYGLRSSSTLVALANAAFLLVACGAIGWEALQRFWSAPEVNTLTVITVATIGIVVNGLSAALFMQGSKGDMNIRGAYLHMAADAAVSLGVVVAAVLIRYTGWNWLDPLTSVLIVAVIIYGTWGLLRESLHLALNAVPRQVDTHAVENYLKGLDGVSSIHDLHVWGMSTTESALTVHLVMPQGYPGDHFMDDITHTLRHRFALLHSTIQIEQGTTQHVCALDAS
jgi:cobalt-zinc-cadmium efflux system protein